MAAHVDDFDTFDLTLAPRGQEVTMRVRRKNVEELARLLGNARLSVYASVPASTAPQQVSEVLIATVETPEMWTALGATVTAFLARNQFRRVRIGKNDITLTGYGPEDAERILRAISEVREQVEQDERERTKRDLPPDQRDDSANGT